jgi:uncharacterized integral membrane protein
MKLVKLFALLAILFLLLLFLVKNTDLVTVDLVVKKYQGVSVAIVMLGALAIGILIGYGVAVTAVLTAKAEIRSLQLRNRRITEELNNLRNVAIDEGIYDVEDEES